MCAVCDGSDTILCTKCLEPFTEKECEDPCSLDNNELLQCATCKKWWHQACHEPNVYPLPTTDFVCSTCDNVRVQHVKGKQLDASLRVSKKRARTPRVPKMPPHPQPTGQAQAEARPRRCSANYASVVGQQDPLGIIGCTVDVTWTWDDDKVFRGVVTKYSEGDDGGYEVPQTHCTNSDLAVEVAYDDGDLRTGDIDEENYHVVTVRTFRESAHLSSTRNGRLSWGTT